MHPFIIAEVSLGSLSQRRLKLSLMERLVRVKVADSDEVSRMIEFHSLYSRGIGFVDVHLIASCLITPGTQLWTRNTRLHTVADAMGLDSRR